MSLPKLVDYEYSSDESETEQSEKEIAIQNNVLENEQKTEYEDSNRVSTEECEAEITLETTESMKSTEIRTNDESLVYRQTAIQNNVLENEQKTEYEDSNRVSTEECEAEITLETTESMKSTEIRTNDESLVYRQTTVSESDSSDSDDSDDPENDFITAEKSGPLEVPRVRGELLINDLPPIEDLTISVKQEETAVLGKIQSIVEQLVVIQSIPGMCAVDIDSVLFLDEGKRALGKVYDILGPVSEPLYCVRFNSKEHIEEKEISVGATVYYAPRTELTSYVFLPDLIKNKGSDASWIGDVEPPEKCLDYSDDEQERAARNAKKRLHAENEGKAQSSNVQERTVQRKTPINKSKNNTFHKKDHNFPMRSASYAQQYNHQQFYSQAYNARPNLPTNNVYHQFPNIGNSAPIPYQPVFNNYLQGPFSNPMMPQNMWHINNMYQNPTTSNQYTPYVATPPLPPPPPPPPPGT